MILFTIYINDQLNIFGLILLETVNILAPTKAIAKTIIGLNIHTSVPKDIGSLGFAMCTIKNRGDTKKTAPIKYKDANTTIAEIIIGIIIPKFISPKPNVPTEFNAFAYVLIPFISFEFSIKYSAIILFPIHSTLPNSKINSCSDLPLSTPS